MRDFAGYKLVIQGRSPKTVDEYMLDLRTFFKFLIARKNGIAYGSDEYEKISLDTVDADFVRRIATTDIYEFMFFAERELGNSAVARARKLSSLRGFFKYCTSKRELLEKDPTLVVDSPKKRQTLPKYLTLDESRLLLAAVRNDEEADEFIRLRNFTMITLFLNCGMRLSELVGTDIGDIDKFLRSLRVLGKGNKERIIYLNDACRAALAEYLPARTSPERGTLPTKALFISSRGVRICNRTVEWTVEKYLRAAGLENRHFSVHKLRHTAATLMYREGGVDVRVLKEILGHEQLNTTQIYTHVSDSDVEAAMYKNPLGDPGASSCGEKGRLGSTEKNEKS